jgi:tetratricopeptide (TPR) repeat protein
MEDNMDQKIEAYLGGQLPPDERKAFEEVMAQNASIREKVRLSDQINHFVGGHFLPENEISKHESAYAKSLQDTLASNDTKEFHKDLTEIANSYHASTNDTDTPQKGGRLIYFLSTAAAIALVIFGLNIFGSSSPSDLYASFYEPSDLPSFTTRSDSKKELLSGMKAFNTGNYEIAIKDLTAFAKAEDEPTAYLYTGIAHLELGHIDAALADFDRLGQSESLDASQAIWYKALVYLKTEQTELAISQLDEITKDPSHFKYEEAKALLKALE